jgi:hypothetical protein
MERHTVRQYLIAERLADTLGIAYDREVLLCASFLHDAGLYGPASSGDVYIRDSARYARRTLEPLGWSEERLGVCIDACEQHHALTSRWWMPNEVELVRRSDLVEVLPELVRFGIPRSWLKRELWQAVPRAGWLLACPTRHSSGALAADAARHVQAAGTRTLVLMTTRRRVREGRTSYFTGLAAVA